MPGLLITSLHLPGRSAKNAIEGLREDSGQSLIELAFVLPSFLLLAFGLINFCMIMFGIGNVSFASRQAARYACLHSQTSLVPVDQPTIDTMIAPYVFKYPSNTYSDQLSYPSGSNTVGATATVKITITYKVVLPFLSIPVIPLSFAASGIITQ